MKLVLTGTVVGVLCLMVVVVAQTEPNTTPPPKPTEAAAAEDLKTSGTAFLTWLEAQGADVTQVGLAIGRAGIAAVARDAMEAGTTIVVPPEVVLNRFSSARQTPALAAALEATEQRGLLLPADVATAVVLMFETFHNPASFWKPYTSLLPLKASHPYFYTASEIALASVVPAMRHRIGSMRDTLLANFQVLHDTMLVHHPEVFGAADEGDETEKFEAWRSQFAWATAMVSLRGIAARTDTGAIVKSMVPLIDLMQYQARDEPTVQGAFASEDAVGFVHTIVDSTPVGTILTYTPPVEVANCNIDLVLHRGLVVNATKWDCAYIWHPLPSRQDKAVSAESFLWQIHLDLGFITPEMFEAGVGVVELPYWSGTPLSEGFFTLIRLAVLAEGDDLGRFVAVLNGNMASLESERRAIASAVARLQKSATDIREQVRALVDEGVIAAEEATWTATETMLGITVAGYIRSVDSAVTELQRHWLSLLQE